MCSLNGCEREGRNVPQIVVTMRDGAQTWDITTVVGVNVCGICKATVKRPEDVLGDGGDRIVGALVKARPTAQCVSRRLTWTTVANADYRRLLESRPS